MGCYLYSLISNVNMLLACIYEIDKIDLVLDMWNPKTFAHYIIASKLLLHGSHGHDFVKQGFLSECIICTVIAKR